MKIMLTIFLSIFLSKGCAQDQELSDVKVVYGANTRGFHRMITIENGTFSLVSQRDGKPSVVNLTDAQWKKLAELYSKINLKTFNDLEGPTMERAYDGKPHADMTIVVKNKTYTTKGFDHTIPPAKIKEFVDYINKIADDSVFKNPILGSYVVEELVGVNVVEKNYFISFDTDKISGFMGCNMYSGTYKLDDENITISPLMATKKYCENEMKNEDTWFKIASNISRFEIENKTIFLLDNDNKVVLKATKK